MHNKDNIWDVIGDLQREVGELKSLVELMAQHRVVESQSNLDKQIGSPYDLSRLRTNPIRLKNRKGKK